MSDSEMSTAKLDAAPAQPGGPRLQSRLPSLDGWRAFSIIMVLGSHTRFVSGFPKQFDSFFGWAFDGNLGVRCFFLISGFLITWLMVLESERTGRVHLGHFYARRALRILPVYFGFLLTILLIQQFSPYRLPREIWLTNATFTRNFVEGDFTTDHLWSLSVEEQFYILWPGLFLLLGMTKNRKLLGFLFIPVLIAPFSRVIGHKFYPAIPAAAVFKSYSFFSYFDSLAVGCACAVLLATARPFLETWLKKKPMRALTVGITMVVGIHVLIQVSRWSYLLRACLWPLGPTVQAFGLAILIVQSVLIPDWGPYRILNWGWIGRIGILSYSIYIWQQIFCTRPEVFGLGPVWWMSFPCWVVSAMAVAFVSYYGFERPFLKLRARFR